MTLLPDDEAPRYDLSEANPDLVGLFEQFRKLTGKKLHPNADDPDDC
jgi:hypothetical protein